jgi:hypothetical protein
MAVNINLISSVGIRSSKPFTEYPSPSVFIETINDLEGKSYVQRSLAAGSLSVSSLSPFIIQGKNTTSTQQVLTFTNNGTRDLTIDNIYFTSVYSSSYGSSEGVLEVQPKVTTGTGWSIVSNEIDGKTIKTMLIPGESRQLNLAYYATAESDPSRVYNNYIGVEIDNSTPNIGGQSLRLFTVQTISDIFNFRLTPFTITNISTISNEVSQYNVSIIPLTPTTSTLSVSIVGTGYYLTDWTNGQYANNVAIEFDNALVNNVTGTYTATLTVSSGIISNTATISTTVNLDNINYQHYGAWLSPGAEYEAVVGISYDKIAGQRTITIGVGAGADGAPAYTLGGANYLSLNNLGLSGAVLAEPYAYWAKVYRIPLDGPAKTYYSGNYVVKSQGVDYGYYFGEYQAPASIFIVDDDGYGNITIKINHLREVPEDDLDVEKTLKNLTRIFYYYSEADVGSRYYQLGSPIGDGTQTELFAGFYNNGSLVTYLVPYPL